MTDQDLTAENAARSECFADCSSGVHLDPEAGCVSVCASPAECQGWVPYLKKGPAMTEIDLTAPEAVERFHASEISSDMIPASRGDYVRYDDYAALSAALEAAKARAEAAEAKLKEAVEALQEIASSGRCEFAKVRAAIRELKGEHP